MARKPSNRPHHRPARRSGDRRSDNTTRPIPRGFTSPGYRQLSTWLMPGLAGDGKRHFFNQLSGAVILAIGLVGAGVGFTYLGWIGGVLGLGVGITVGGWYVEQQRFYRR